MEAEVFFFKVSLQFEISVVWLTLLFYIIRRTSNEVLNYLLCIFQLPWLRFDGCSQRSPPTAQRGRRSHPLPLRQSNHRLSVELWGWNLHNQVLDARKETSYFQRFFTPLFGLIWLNIKYVFICLLSVCVVNIHKHFCCRVWIHLFTFLFISLFIFPYWSF